MSREGAIVSCVAIVAAAALLIALIAADYKKHELYVKAGYTRAMLPGYSSLSWVKP